MLRVTTFRLYPSKAQEQRLFHLLYVGRKLYNHSLNQRIQFYKETGKSLSYSDQTADLTVLRSISQVLADVPCVIERDALNRLDLAFEAFFRRCKAGEAKAGFPRFKPAQRWNSFATCQPGKVVVLGNRIKVQGVDTPLRARNVRPVSGQIKQLRIVHRAGQWFAKLNIDDKLEAPPKLPIVNEIGIDVGLTHFAALSNGDLVSNPRFRRKLENKLRRAHRRVSQRLKGGSNRRKAVTQLQREYAKVSDQRWNFTHHLSKQLVGKYQLIAIEKLNIKGMAKGHFAKSILDAAWGQLFHQLHYKAENAGVTVMSVNPRGTSQECSGCGNLVLKDLSVRIHDCPKCGLKINRDVNSARTVLARAKAELAQANTAGRAGINACGDAKGRRRSRKS